MRRSFARSRLHKISNTGSTLATIAACLVVASWLLRGIALLLNNPARPSPSPQVAEPPENVPAGSSRARMPGLRLAIGLALLATSIVATGATVALTPLFGVGTSRAAPPASYASDVAARRVSAAARTPGEGSLSFSLLATQTEAHRPTATTTPTPTPTATATPTVTPTPTPPFVWPADGWISQELTAKHPAGIDIAVNTGEPVYAVRAGYVEIAGGDPCCGYGYYVYLDHEDGWSSLYAHLSSFAVTVGERVEQGDLLGLSGETGKARGAHLHFELRYGGGVVDPLQYLPPQ